MPSKAGKFADAAEALGWSVERVLGNDGDRIVKTRRGDEQYNFAWGVSESGVLTLVIGWHWIGAEATEIANVAAALREMAEPEALNFVTAPDAEVIDYLRGRRITWTNTISGLEESAIVPAHGKQTKLRTVTRRVLDFAADEGGFRSVALDAITKVGK